MRPATRNRLERTLRQRIEHRYATSIRTLDFDGLCVRFTCVADPDRVLDEVAEEQDLLERLSGRRANGDQLPLPYWAELWDSAIGIGQWLVEKRRAEEKSRSEVGGRGLVEERDPSLAAAVTTSDLQPPASDLQPLTSDLQPATSSFSRVLDLGCGMGLAGTVAAALGAKVVLFADLETPALLFAQLNSLPWRRRVRTRQLNWQTDRLDEHFDLILGADILYERKQWDHLEPFWRAHLAPGGIVLLGEPGRQTGDLFIDWIASRGWSLKQDQRKAPGRERAIRLLELRTL